MNIVLIYSGGLDSTVLLWHLLAQGNKLRALSVNYGQRHAVELESASKLCAQVGVEHQIADLSGLRHLLAGSSQTSPGLPVPHGHYTAESMKLTVVPNRNAIMLSIAAAWAISTRSDCVAYGAHAGDHAIYPDCREEFIRPFTEALAHADWHRVGLLRPFIGLSKTDIVREGARLGVPFIETFSCYEGIRGQHCGLCGTCVERREAFHLAEVPDPTLYVSPCAA